MKRHTKKKPVVHHSTAEKAHLRRVKRKSGPSATRRAERRAALKKVSNG